jgi:hypothetical protein
MLDSIIFRRHVLISVLSIVVAPSIMVAQGRASGAGAKACALLTRPLVEKVSAASKKPVDAAGPHELPLGANGTACEWGDVTLQVDPWPPARLEAMRQSTGKEWEVIKGVGDAAYLHNIQNVMAELFVRVGGRTFAVLVNIPQGTTTAAFKPTIVEVANMVVPKMR